MFTNRDYERIIKLNLVDNTESTYKMLKLIDKDADTDTLLDIEDGLSTMVFGAIHYTELSNTISERKSINNWFKEEGKLWLRKVQ